MFLRPKLFNFTKCMHPLWLFTRTPWSEKNCNIHHLEHLTHPRSALTTLQGHQCTSFDCIKCTLNVNTCLSAELSCVKVEVADLGSPSLIVCRISVNAKQHWTMSIILSCAWSTGNSTPNPAWPYSTHQATEQAGDKPRESSYILTRWESPTATRGNGG